MPVMSKPAVFDEVEALLDEVAQERNLGETMSTDADADTSRRDTHRRDDRYRDRSRDRHRDRDYRDRSRDRHGGRQDRYRESNGEGRDSAERERRRRDGSRPRSSRDADTGEGEDRYRRSTSRDRNGHRGGRPRGGAGDYYSGGGRARSRSPRRDRGHDERRGERREYRRDRDDDRRVQDHRRRTVTPEANDDDRDKRTIFVQQIAGRAETRHLRDFFSKAGPVIEAQIVKDRVTGRSKGVGYVEFKDEESVPKAIELTGQKLKGVPIIAQLTEAEKNRVSRAAGEGNAVVGKNGVPFHRLFIGNIHFSVTEADLEDIFRPYGELEQVVLQRDPPPSNRSRGYGHVQFVDPNHARQALTEMNGFELAGRQIRVGLGSDKFTPESTAFLLRNFNQQAATYQGSAFSGAGGRGAYAGGTGGVFDRANGRDDRGISGASALDDTDMSGVSFKQVDRNKLMRNLARNEIDVPVAKELPPAQRRAATVVEEPKSRCIKIENAFDPVYELDNFGHAWTSNLETEVKTECDDKYGRVVHIAVDPNSDGDIYVKFDSKAGAEKAYQGDRKSVV